jgi:hypothetical protein
MFFRIDDNVFPYYSQSLQFWVHQASGSLPEADFRTRNQNNNIDSKQASGCFCYC